MQTATTFEELMHAVSLGTQPKQRRLIAVAGPPASGKTTLAERLAGALTERGDIAQVVPMDGFHLDNRLLDADDLRRRKGAPETFDVRGFAALLSRVPQEAEVVYPVFDRHLDAAIAGAGRIDAGCTTVIVEGNYLLFDAPLWQDLRPLWDFSIALDVAPEDLRRRLIQRWIAHGFSEATAAKRADDNDLPNALRVTQSMLQPDMIYQPGS